MVCYGIFWRGQLRALEDLSVSRVKKNSSVDSSNVPSATPDRIICQFQTILAYMNHAENGFDLVI